MKVGLQLMVQLQVKSQIQVDNRKQIPIGICDVKMNSIQISVIVHALRAYSFCLLVTSVEFL